MCLLLGLGDSSIEVNILARIHGCVRKMSNDEHAFFPVLVHANVLLRNALERRVAAGQFLLLCRGMFGHEALFTMFCGLRGRVRILLVPCGGSQD